MSGEVGKLKEKVWKKMGGDKTEEGEGEGGSSPCAKLSGSEVRPDMLLFGY
jgi:hypothetical protein